MARPPLEKGRERIQQRMTRQPHDTLPTADTTAVPRLRHSSILSPVTCKHSFINARKLNRLAARFVPPGIASTGNGEPGVTIGCGAATPCAQRRRLTGQRWLRELSTRECRATAARQIDTAGRGAPAGCSVHAPGHASPEIMLRRRASAMIRVTGRRKSVRLILKENGCLPYK